MLGKKIIVYHTKNALKQNNTQRANTNYREAGNIGLVHTFSSQDDLQEVYNFYDQLESEGKKVHVLVLKDKKQDINVPEFTLINFQDISNLGKWTNDSVHVFSDKSFDYLFHIDLNSNQYADNILANSKAKCRVGNYSDSKGSFYELMIKPENNSITHLIQQINHYIKRF